SAAAGARQMRVWAMELRVTGLVLEIAPTAPSCRLPSALWRFSGIGRAARLLIPRPESDPGSHCGSTCDLPRIHSRAKQHRLFQSLARSTLTLQRPKTVWDVDGFLLKSRFEECRLCAWHKSFTCGVCS